MADHDERIWGNRGRPYEEYARWRPAGHRDRYRDYGQGSSGRYYGQDYGGGRGREDEARGGGFGREHDWDEERRVRGGYGPEVGRRGPEDRRDLYARGRERAFPANPDRGDYGQYFGGGGYLDRDRREYGGLGFQDRYGRGYGGYGYSGRHGPERGYAPERGARHHIGKGPRGYTRSDARIREDVSDRLTDDPYVDASEIEVLVHNGEVTLNGTVESRAMKRRAEDLAEAVSGVRHTQNNLRLQAPGATRML